MFKKGIVLGNPFWLCCYFVIWLLADYYFLYGVAGAYNVDARAGDGNLGAGRCGFLFGYLATEGRDYGYFAFGIFDIYGVRETPYFNNGSIGNF